MLRAAIISQGDEVVTGQTVDTNAAWLAERLTEVGFVVVEHVAVRDVRAEITAAFLRSAQLADVVVCTGGLGPTEDDLTAEAMSAAADVPLALDQEALTHIQALYARFRREMPKINEKQAWLPVGALRLDNDWGTAPAFAVQVHDACVVCLPGVPREMRALWAHRVLPLLEERFQIEPGRLVTLRTTGIGESNLQERIGPFSASQVVLGYRTMLPENHVKLRFEPGASDAHVREVTADVADRIGTPVFAIEGLGGQEGNLYDIVGQSLVARGETVAVAESCTGGRIASECTTIAGASAWFLEGAVTYSNAAKVRALGVPAALIETHGAVSEPVAVAMAEGIRTRSDATWGISTTGIAGPSGGSKEKPVGTVHIAVAGPSGTTHRKLHFGGDRERIQALSAGAAIELLRRNLV